MESFLNLLLRPTPHGGDGPCCSLPSALNPPWLGRFHGRSLPQHSVPVSILLLVAVNCHLKNRCLKGPRHELRETGDEESILLRRYYPQSLAAGREEYLPLWRCTNSSRCRYLRLSSMVLRARICSAAALAAYSLVHAIIKSDSPKSTMGRCSWSVRKARLLWLHRESQSSLAPMESRKKLDGSHNGTQWACGPKDYRGSGPRTLGPKHREGVRCILSPASFPRLAGARREATRRPAARIG